MSYITRQKIRDQLGAALMESEYEAHDVSSSGTGGELPTLPPDHLERHKCDECERDLADETTVYIHGRKLFCSSCFNAEAGS